MPVTSPPGLLSLKTSNSWQLSGSVFESWPRMRPKLLLPSARAGQSVTLHKGTHLPDITPNREQGGKGFTPKWPHISFGLRPINHAVLGACLLSRPQMIVQGLSETTHTHTHTQPPHDTRLGNAESFAQDHKAEKLQRKSISPQPHLSCAQNSCC